jgi:putative heme-binding domain-containing protein
LAKFNSEAARAALVRLAKESATREFALRALGDHATAAATVPTEPFVAALRDSDARVRLQAASALGRLGKRESASALLPLVADADPRVAHVAVHALVSLRAADVCLQALDSAGLANVVPGAMRVLQRLHEPAVVSGLLTRLETTTDATLRRAMLKGLARLYNREADWDGKWWGTRPDTTGPYYKPVKWAESERIGAALRQELAAANAEMLRWLVVELQKNRVDLPELTGVALKLAREDEAFKAVAVELFATRSSLPDEAIPLFGDVAKAESQPVALRAKAVRVLQRASAKADARDAAIAALTTPEKLSGELNNAWEDFARDTRHAGSIERFRELAEDGSASARTLGYAVLVHLSTQRLSSKEARVAAERAVEQAWSKPDALVPLLKAVTRMRANAYALQVGSLLKDSRPDVAQAAKAADEAIGRRKGNKTDEPLIEKLDYHELMARVMKEKGDAKAGRDLFTRAGCAACHTATADEPLKGPYLGGIAARYSRPELCESIIKPNEKIAQGFETQWFKLKDDEEVEGFVTREGGDDLDVRNIAGITTTVAKKDIVERGKREISAMPPGLVDKLTPGELASLLAFLESLKSK